MPPAGIVDRIRLAGVVGAGGAGFPTHVKAGSKADVVIANGAECEPLLHKDKELQKRFASLVLDGIELMMAATGAKLGVAAVKAKYKDVVAAYEAALKGRRGLKLHPLGDFYPAGDEYTLVYEVQRKLIPPAGLPLQVGAVVDNVETLLNVALAAKQPVTDTYLTVTGAVHEPVTVKLPIGTPISAALALAGNPTVKEFGVIDGGPMMGRVADLSEPLTKTSSGLIVLPLTHKLMLKKSASRQRIARIGQAACDQCSFCTQFCPRYLLGYAIEPHRVMRSLGFVGAERKTHSEWSLLCCECSLCSLYACPEELDPRNVCIGGKAVLREKGVDWKTATINRGSAPGAHPMREFRKVPIDSLVRRLGLWDYQAQARLRDGVPPVRRVRIPLKQHVGVPCQPVVKPGQKVGRGDLLGEIPEGKLGARVHASIDGTVTAVDTAVTIEG